MRFHYEGPVCGVNKKSMPSRGRIISTPKYRDFLKALTYTFQAQRRTDTLIESPFVSIRMYIHPLMDSDALLKPIFDALQHAGVVKNDNLIRKYEVEAIRKTGQPRLEIEVTPFEQSETTK